MQKTESIWRTLVEHDPVAIKKNGHAYKFVKAPPGWFETVAAPDGTEFDIGFVKTDWSDEDGTYRSGWYAIEMESGMAITADKFNTRQDALDMMTTEFLSKLSSRMNDDDVRNICSLLRQEASISSR